MQLIELENEYLYIAFSPKTGAILRLRNNLLNMDLIKIPVKNPQPFFLVFNGVETGAFTKFESTRLPAKDSIYFRWETEYGVIIHAKVHLSTGSDRLEFWCGVVSNSNKVIHKLYYPILILSVLNLEYFLT